MSNANAQTQVASQVTPLLRVRGIHKSYPGVHALSGVDLDIYAGEAHALVGENGAGKSTLMKVLAGSVVPDSGVIELNGREVSVRTPHDAHALGVRMIYQELDLVPALSVAENIFLNVEPSRWGVINRRELRQRSVALLARLGQKIDVDERVERLPLATQQMVEIAKALASESTRVLIMDEPSAILTEAELRELFRLIDKLKSEGVAVIYISHRMDEIQRIADRVTVLRDGRSVRSSVPLRDLTLDEIVFLMVGRELAKGYPDSPAQAREELLRVESLSAGPVRDVSFTLRRGETLGIVGLVGSGRTELARAIFGADKIDAGAIYLEGKRITPRSPREAIDLGIGFLTEDRKGQGLILHDPVRQNISLATLERITPRGFINQRQERENARAWVKELNIRTPTIEQRVRNLSGGNQQKVVLARWLLARSRVLIFDEPTRGVDVGAKAEIYALMRRLVAEGAGIIMISSELPEAIGMCDRLLVMREGRVVGELPKEEATAERVGQLMMKIRSNHDAS